MKPDLIGGIGKAWDRMAEVLFRPFDPMKWLLIGLAAFLTQLGGGGFYRFALRLPNALDRKKAFADGPAGLAVPDGLADLGLPLLAIGGCIALLVLVLVPLFLWLGSRGEFIFVENVATNSAAFQDAWRRYRELGWSLFLWRLGFFALTLGAILVVGLPFALSVYAAESSAGSGLVWGVGAIVTLCGVVLVAVAAAFVGLLTQSFVVPIMMRENLRTMAAWRAFLPVFKPNALGIVLYALLILILSVAVGVAVLAFGFATCCLGLIVLMIPYVSTVLMLPVHVFFRAYSLVLLADLKPEWDLFGLRPLEVLSLPAEGTGE